MRYTPAASTPSPGTASPPNQSQPDQYIVASPSVVARPLALCENHDHGPTSLTAALFRLAELRDDAASQRAAPQELIGVWCWRSSVGADQPTSPFSQRAPPSQAAGTSAHMKAAREPEHEKKGHYQSNRSAKSGSAILPVTVEPTSGADQ
jgi:hypothetical protein